MHARPVASPAASTRSGQMSVQGKVAEEAHGHDASTPGGRAVPGCAHTLARSPPPCDSSYWTNGHQRFAAAAAQFGYAPEELWKSNLLVNARPGDIAEGGHKFKAGQLVFVSEKRLGFGSFASSNIAQRYSNALTGWALEEFDKLEMEARAAAPDPLWEGWIAKRTPLEAECRARRPKRAGLALTDCTQTRLAVITMFTDDPLAGVVGVRRALRLLEAWRRVTQGSGLVMAGADKRQLGGGVEWIGVYVLAAIGLIAIPKNKLLRARDAIQRTLSTGITFGEYRALVGLLEHLRFVSRLQADATNALYNPHRKGGEKEDGPSTDVGVTELMRGLLDRWLKIIMECAGAVLTIIFEDNAEEKLKNARTIFAGSSDAAGDGRGSPGIGGYLHGYYWRVALPPTILALMHITGWETLAACVNVLVAARLAGPKAMLLLRVDALLTPYVLSKQKSKSADIQHMVKELIVLPDYDTGIAIRLLLQHLSGDGNVPSDLTSRALWEELAQLCLLMKVKPVLVLLQERELQLIKNVLRAAATRRDDELDDVLLMASVQTAVPAELLDEVAVRARWQGAKRGRPLSPPPPTSPRHAAPMVPNWQVDAESMHATSTNLGLAADPVAQADYDMAASEWCHRKEYVRSRNLPRYYILRDNRAVDGPFSGAQMASWFATPGRLHLDLPIAISYDNGPWATKAPGDSPWYTMDRKGRVYGPFTNADMSEQWRAQGKQQPLDLPEVDAGEVQAGRSSGTLFAGILGFMRLKDMIGYPPFEQPRLPANFRDKTMEELAQAGHSMREIVHGAMLEPSLAPLALVSRAEERAAREGPALPTAPQPRLPRSRPAAPRVQPAPPPRAPPNPLPATNSVDEEGQLAPMVPNEEVDAAAMHATSNNLGLAADPLAQADHRMADLPREQPHRCENQYGEWVVCRHGGCGGWFCENCKVPRPPPWHPCHTGGTCGVAPAGGAELRTSERAVQPEEQTCSTCDDETASNQDLAGHEQGRRHTSHRKWNQMIKASHGNTPMLNSINLNCSPYSRTREVHEYAVSYNGHVMPTIRRGVPLKVRREAALRFYYQWRGPIPSCFATYAAERDAIVDAIASFDDAEKYVGIACASAKESAQRLRLTSYDLRTMQGNGPSPGRRWRHGDDETQAWAPSDRPTSPVHQPTVFMQLRDLCNVACIEYAHATLDLRVAHANLASAVRQYELVRSRSKRAGSGSTSLLATIDGVYLGAAGVGGDLKYEQAALANFRKLLPQRPGDMWFEHRPNVGASSSSPLAQEVIQHLGFVPAWAQVKQEKPEPSDPETKQASNTFKPAWATRPEKPPPTGPSDRRPPREAQRAEFKPAWVLNRQAGHRRGVNRAPTRDANVHPYAKPAYGASRLRPDQVATAAALAKRLANDRTPGRIDAPEDQLLDMATAVAEARADGTNPRTGSKDAFALREWEAYAELTGFDPNLQSEWTRRFPERESLKLATWLLWRAQRAVPRSRKGVAKPMSIYQNYLALRRVFNSRNVELPQPGTVRETLRGLIRRFIRRFGIEALRPKRVEPVTPPIVMRCLQMAKEGTSTIKGHKWCLRTNWTCFIVNAWMVINLSVGSRKGESTKLDGDVDHNDWFDRAAVSYCIKGRTYAGDHRPPDAELNSMSEGDHAALAPKGAKCDQWGTCHGTEPIILPFHDRDDNAARWLRDIEIRCRAEGPERSKMPLFADSNGNPFRDATFASLIMETLKATIGENRAKLLSPHSWRVWLASSLRMCNASDARIQAMGRWLNPESIKLYARMTKQEYAGWVDKLMSVKRIDTARTTSLPIMDAADAIAAWGDQLHVEKTNELEKWQPGPVNEPVPPSQLKNGDRVSVFWTDMQEWYEGTFKTSRIEAADGGGKQRTSCVVYDATGLWATCSLKDLTYWHCLDDEQWNPL